MDIPLSLIVATDPNLAIGKDNDLLWRIPSDLKRFKALTTGHVIIMGYNTYLSLPKGALPNRTNVVLTSKNIDLEGCTVVHSIEEALKVCNLEKENFIIGGASIYRQFLPYCNKLYITRVHASFEADTFFPSIKMEDWRVIHEEHLNQETPQPLEYSFIDLERN